MPRRGFTLIELLVTIAIIVVLVSLLLPTVGWGMRSARIAGSTQRINGVVVALAGLAQGTEGATPRLQAAGNLGGALTLDYTPHLAPKTGAWLDYALTWNRRFPLGQTGIAFGTAGGGKATATAPADFALTNMNPRRSYELLTAAGILRPGEEGRKAYATNRSDNVAWNDRWGSPLVVAYALFQYGPAGGANESAAGTAGFDNQWRQVQQRYGYTRSTVLVVGAGGPTLPTSFNETTSLATPAARDSALPELWAHIDAVANRAPDGVTPLWRINSAASVNAMERAPWTGVRHARHTDGRIALLSSPEELR